MATTPNMSLTTWGPNDYFNDLQLKANWEKVDSHNHDPENDGGVRINTNGIVDGAINELKLADSAVTSHKIADGTITKFKLANDLLIALEKAAEAINFETQFGTGTTSDIEGTYDDLQIKSSTVVDTHIAPGAKIAPSKIDFKTSSGQALSDVNGIVDQAALAQGDITGPFGNLQIGTGTVGPTELAFNAVNTNNLLNNAVTSAKIANGTIQGEDIAPSTITADKTYSGAWTAFTPTWGSLSGPAPGPGYYTSVKGRWTRYHGTVMVHVIVKCGFGGFGSDNSLVWSLNLPGGLIATSNVMGTWAIRFNNGSSRGGHATSSEGGTGVAFLDLGGQGNSSASYSGYLDSQTNTGTYRAAYWQDGTQFSTMLTFPAQSAV